jgi:predicted permease
LILKGLTRSPGLSLAAVVVLALGVGAPTAMYSISRAITTDLPVPDPGRLVYPAYTDLSRAPSTTSLSPRELGALRSRPTALGNIGGFRSVAFDLGGGVGEPERVAGAHITHDLLEVLGERPVAGRGLLPSDGTEAAPVALIGDRLWRERFGADPALLGGTVRLNGTPHTVVGILPGHFLFPTGAEVWTSLEPELRASAEDGVRRGYGAVARLPRDVDPERARAEVAAVGAGLFAGADAQEGARLTLHDYRSGSMLNRRIDVVLAAMVGLVSCLLLISAANVANLLLARAVSRSRELAVRVALGSGPRRLIAHHVVEAGALSLMGGALGLGLAAVMTEGFRRSVAHELEWWMVVEIDPAVVAFAVALMMLATVVAGALPALQASGSSLSRTLRADGRSGGSVHFSRLSQALVVGEVTVSAALLVVSGLMVKSALRTTRWQEDFDAAGILTAGYTLPAEGTFVTEPAAFHRELLERVETRAGVAGAAFTGHLPGLGSPIYPFEVEGATVTPDRPGAQITHVSPGLFEMLGAPLLRGRDLAWSDGAEDPPAVLVNEPFARRYFPNGDAIGRRLRLLPPLVPEPTLAAIVGVTAPVRTQVGVDERPEAVYLPATLDVRSGWVLVAGAAGRDPLTLIPELRDAVRSLDPDRPLASIDLLSQHLRRARLADSSFGWLFAAFGLAGLLVAFTGLYGVMAFAVGRRTREVGVRVALGAKPSGVAWTVIRAGALQMTIGLGLGFGVALLVGPLVGAALVDVSPRDPAVYALVTAVLLVSGISAATVPALRALRIQPTEALKSD